MSEIEHWMYSSSEFQAFGRRIFHEKATVITFNYDCLLESAIAAASPPRRDAMKAPSSRAPRDNVISDEDIGYSFHEWNPYVAYKVMFDEVELLTPGLARTVEGTRYYRDARNKMDLPAFLKMHGSLGWFYHSGYRVDGTKLEGQEASKAGQSVLRKGFYRIGFPQLHFPDATAHANSSSSRWILPEILLPLIIHMSYIRFF
jgi:hypothetical protein